MTWNCTKCHKSFLAKRSIRQHKCHPICCVRCDRLFKTQRMLREHMKICNGRKAKYRCEICGRRCASAVTLRRHGLNIHNKKKDKAADVEEYADEEALPTHQTSEEGREDIEDAADYQNMPNELMKELKRKICVLSTEQTTIEEESAIDDELGSSLIKKCTEKIRPTETIKFRTYIDDIRHVAVLLISLSERLARLENSLSEMEEYSAERKTLESKRDRLLEQLEEAFSLPSTQQLTIKCENHQNGSDCG